MAATETALARTAERSLETTESATCPEPRVITEPTAVVFTFDRGFLPYAIVAMTSLLVHSKHHVRVYCVTDGLEADDVRLLERAFLGYDAELRLVEASRHIFAQWKVLFHYSTANYFRLEAPSLIPDKRVIYLDCDLLVTCDLRELFTIDLQGAWLAACLDPDGKRVATVPIGADEPYINTGVLVLDLEALRQADFGALARQAYRANADTVQFADQCVINLVAEGRKLVLEPRWNVQQHNIPWPRQAEVMASFDRRAILHASGPVKPWMSWSDPWIANLWRSYARLTELDVASLLKDATTYQQHVWKAAALDAQGRWKEASELKGRLLAHLQSQPRASEPPRG